MIALINKLTDFAPIWLWVILATCLVGLFTFLIQKNGQITKRNSTITFISLSLISMFFSWMNYLDNHFVGAYTEEGVPSIFSRSGWRLIFDAWPLWLGPTIFFCGLIILAYWAYKEYHIAEFIKMLDDEDGLDPNKPKAPSSDDIIKQTLETAKLKRKLAVSEEKYKIALQRHTQPSVKDTRTTMNIKQLREQLVETKRMNAALKAEINALTSDLERTNNLVDQLLEEKYGKSE